MPPTARKPESPKFAAEKTGDQNKSNAPVVGSREDNVHTNEDVNEVRGGQDLHTRIETLESRVSDFISECRAALETRTSDPADKRHAQDDYERDDDGNVVNPEENDLAITTDTAGNVVRDPNKR